MNKSLLIAFGLCCLSLTAWSQTNNHLILKKGYKNQLHYLTGDEIRFTDIRSDIPIIGYIQEIGEEFITVNKTVYPINEIVTIVKRRKSFNYRSGGKILQIAGPGLMLIGASNSLIQGTRPIWPLRTILSAAVITLTGFLLPHLEDKVYKLGEKYHLRIVPSDPELFRQ